MKVISTTDLSHEGNDCYIYKSVNLVETFGMYAVIITEKIVGWFQNKEIYTVGEPCEILSKAILLYKEYDGVWED